MLGEDSRFHPVDFSHVRMQYTVLDLVLKDNACIGLPHSQHYYHA